jgi:hypothetical protein
MYAKPPDVGIKGNMKTETKYNGKIYRMAKIE